MHVKVVTVSFVVALLTLLFSLPDVLVSVLALSSHVGRLFRGMFPLVSGLLSAVDVVQRSSHEICFKITSLSMCKQHSDSVPCLG